TVSCGQRRAVSPRRDQYQFRAGGDFSFLPGCVPLGRRRGAVIVSCMMANFGAFVYMNLRGIGLTVDTIPIISLGIGLGVDYGIYTIARIRDEVVGGRSLDEAIVTALRTTGGAVFCTFAVMVGGILPWAFSPVLFHNEMSLLLIFLMATNMIAGVLILPCFIAWRRPAFICRHEQLHDSDKAEAASSPQ